MLVWVTVVETSTTGDAPLTVTVSCRLPTPSSTSTRAVRATCTMMPFAPERREAGEIERHDVGAGRQGELVAAGLTGDAGAAAANQAVARHRDRHTGEHAALRVADQAGERAGLLGERRRRGGHEHGDRERHAAG